MLTGAQQTPHREELHSRIQKAILDYESVTGWKVVGLEYSPEKMTVMAFVHPAPKPPSSR